MRTPIGTKRAHAEVSSAIGCHAKREDIMNETRYRQVLASFLNDYWGAFHEVLEAESVNPGRLAASLFDPLVAEHGRFAALYGGVHPALERLGQLWRYVAERRGLTDAPLTARELAHARMQFQQVYDTLIGSGTAYPHISTEVLAHAVHGHPRAELRADAAR
jgi:hypothetical protein